MTSGEFRTENEDIFILLLRKSQQDQPLSVEAKKARFPYHDVTSAFVSLSLSLSRYRPRCSSPTPCKAHSFSPRRHKIIAGLFP